jgi:hypothetical protein
MCHSGGSGYLIPGIPEPDWNYFVIPEPVWPGSEPAKNRLGKAKNQLGTGLWIGGYPECQNWTIFKQNMATFE